MLISCVAMDSKVRDTNYRKYVIVGTRAVTGRNGYKAFDMESGKDASIMESRTVRAHSERERQKIRGFDKVLSEGDKRLKRAIDSESCRWQYSSVVRGKLDSAADSHSDTKGVKSTVERKESLLDEVAVEEAKLEHIKGGGAKPSGESEEKADEGRSASADDLKEIEERIRLAVLQGEEDMSKMVEAKANLDEMVKERDRLGRHLILKGYSEEEVDTIKANTYIEDEDEEKAEVVGVMEGLDGVSRQMVLDNHGDDVEHPEGGSEKVKLDSSRSHEEDVLMCIWEFAEQFDQMKKVNKIREDQYEKVHFRLVKLTQAVSNLTLQVEEKYSEIKKGLKELSEVTERAEKLQHQIDTLAVK
ncbi:hypothetical protein GIB67_021455, partial [Kingdonia uniflora]